MNKLNLLLLFAVAVAVHANPTPYNLDAISDAALNNNWNAVGRIVDNDIDRRFHFVPHNQPGPVNQPGGEVSANSPEEHVYAIRTNIVKEVTYENGRPVVHSYGHEDIYNDGKVESYDFNPQ